MSDPEDDIMGGRRHDVDVARMKMFLQPLLKFIPKSHLRFVLSELRNRKYRSLLPFVVTLLAILLIYSLAFSGSRGSWGQYGRGGWRSSSASESGAPNSVAICMFGGARIFEITGQTMAKYFFQVYSPADLFIDASLDEDAAKIPLLFAHLREAGERKYGKAASGITLRAVRFTPYVPMDVNKFPSVKAVDKWSSTSGYQGLLQQWAHIEGCWNLLLAHEQRRNLRYDWVIKVRPDFYWNSAPRPLASLPPGKVTIPDAHDFGGLNDQFAIMGRDLGDSCLRPLGLLEEGVGNWKGDRPFNDAMSPEQLFKSQLEYGGVTVNRLPFPYCLTAYRPLQPWRNWKETLVHTPNGKDCTTNLYSILSPGPMNGFYCNPCKACDMTAEETEDFLGSIPKDNIWYVGSRKDGKIMCDYSIYDSQFSDLYGSYLDAIGPEATAEARVVSTMSQSLEKCIVSVRKVLPGGGNPLLANAAGICTRAKLGSPAAAGGSSAESGGGGSGREYNQIVVKPVFSVFLWGGRENSFLYFAGPAEGVPAQLSGMFQLRNYETAARVGPTDSSSTFRMDAFVPWDVFNSPTFGTANGLRFCQLYLVGLREVTSDVAMKVKRWAGGNMVLDSCQFLQEPVLGCSFFSTRFCLLEARSVTPDLLMPDAAAGGGAQLEEFGAGEGGAAAGDLSDPSSPLLQADAGGDGAAEKKVVAFIDNFEEGGTDASGAADNAAEAAGAAKDNAAATSGHLKDDILLQDNSVRLDKGGAVGGKKEEEEFLEEEEEEDSGPGQKNKIAVCIFGGSRNSELTAHSVMTQFFQVYTPSDLFMNTNYDDNAYKFPMFFSRLHKFGEISQAAAAIQLVYMRIQPFIPVDVSKFPGEVLDKSASTGGLQGQFQQYKLIEGCWDDIVMFERNRRKKYSWIIKGRPDFYWNNPPPQLWTLPKDKHTIPDGRDYNGGINDQLSFIPRHLGDWSMRRLTRFADAVSAYRPEDMTNGMNCEHVFRGQIAAGNIPIHRVPFPYCLAIFRPLQHYRVAPYPFEGKQCSLYLHSIKSTGYLNGFYCAPCKPCMSAEKAKPLLESFPEGHNVHISSRVEGNLPCDLSDDSLPEFSNLHEAYLEAIGWGPAEEARAILQVANSKEKCLAALDEVAGLALEWMAPSPAQICARARLGKAKRENPNEKISYGALEARSPMSVFAKPGRNESILFAYKSAKKVPRELKVFFSQPPQVVANFNGPAEHFRQGDIFVAASLFDEILHVPLSKFLFCQMYTTIWLKDLEAFMLKTSVWETLEMTLESCQTLRGNALGCTFFSAENCFPQ